MVTRDLGNAPEQLRWQGKLTMIGACTGAIDNYSVHADALGPRWLYYRLPARDTAGKRAAADAARGKNLESLRADAANLATQIVLAARERVNPHIPNHVAEAIEDAALVTCWGRATVPRHGYGRREIDGLPIIEEPPRLIRQLRGLAAGLYAVGATHTAVVQLCRRVALDSMPSARLAALRGLVAAPGSATAALAQRARLERGVARRQLEELEQIGVVACERQGDEPADLEPDRRPAYWSLTGTDGELITKVLSYP